MLRVKHGEKISHRAGPPQYTRERDTYCSCQAYLTLYKPLPVPVAQRFLRIGMKIKTSEAPAGFCTAFYIFVSNHCTRNILNEAKLTGSKETVLKSSLGEVEARSNVLEGKKERKGASIKCGEPFIKYKSKQNYWNLSKFLQHEMKLLYPSITAM